MYDSIVTRKPPTEGRHWEAAYASMQSVGGAAANKNYAEYLI